MLCVFFFSSSSRHTRFELVTGVQTCALPIFAGAIKREYAYDDSVLTVRQIRSARPSPDGKRLVLVALDKLWLMDLPNGKPRRITASTGAGEFAPDWSPDGRYIAYV